MNDLMSRGGAQGNGRQIRGFALLMVLVVLALAVSIIGLAARRTTQTTREALAAERELRIKYARAAGDPLLAQAESLLIQVKDGQERHAAHRLFTLEMDGRKVVVLLADEQAKPQLNSLARRMRPEDLEDLIMSCGGRTPWAVPDGRRPFWCYEQLTGGGPSRMLGGPWPEAQRTTLAGQFTLWGDGRLHAQAADRSSWIRVLAPDVPQAAVEHLVAGLPPQWPVKGDLSTVFAPLTARWTPEQKQVLQQRTTADSSVWSTWTAVGEPAAVGAPSKPDPWAYQLTIRQKETQGDRWRRMGW